MTEPSLLQVAFAHLLLGAIFVFGMYATAFFFQWIKLTRILFWGLVGAIYLGAVLPLLLVVAGIGEMVPPVPTASLLALAVNIGGSTLIGTIYGFRQWKKL